MKRFLLAMLTPALLAGTALAAPVLEQPRPASDMTFSHEPVVQDIKTYAAIDLKIEGITDGNPIPYANAYCAPDGNGKTVNGGNISPAIHWLNAPEATKSFALIVVDRDVPASFDDANKEGKDIALDFPRQDFYHWVLVDIPPTTLALYEGADSKAVTPGGKQVGRRAYGIDGRNDFSRKSDGPNGGYDGPCPPWNDLRLHHYHFMLYALDVPSLGLPNPITAAQALSVMKDHIIAKGEVTGTFSNHTRWVPELKRQAEALAAAAEETAREKTISTPNDVTTPSFK